MSYESSSSIVQLLPVQYHLQFRFTQVPLSYVTDLNLLSLSQLSFNNALELG